MVKEWSSINVQVLHIGARVARRLQGSSRDRDIVLTTVLVELKDSPAALLHVQVELTGMGCHRKWWFQYVWLMFRGGEHHLAAKFLVLLVIKNAVWGHNNSLWIWVKFSNSLIWLIAWTLVIVSLFPPRCTDDGAGHVAPALPSLESRATTALLQGSHCSSFTLPTAFGEGVSNLFFQYDLILCKWLQQPLPSS